MRGICCVCNVFDELTKEHSPPKSAFNSFPLLLKEMDFSQIFRTGEVAWKNGQKQQAGNKAPTLCGSCNNNTGSWYASNYAFFVKDVAKYASVLHTDSVISVLIHDIYPLRIAKQALTMLCTTCGPDLARNNPQITKLLLDKHSRERLEKFRLFLYLRNTQGMRAMNIASSFNRISRRSRTAAEFSWWPVGWVLASDSTHVAEEEATDVSYWLSDFDYSDRESICLKLPCHWTETAYPLDFRSPKELEETRLKNMGIEPP